MRGREAFEMPVEIPDAVWTSVYERGIPAAVADMLPARVRGEVSAVAAGLCGIEEVRLHTGRRITLTASGDISRAEGRSVNYPTPAVLSQAEMDGVLTLLCGGSLYACRDTIVRGYVTYRGGYRVGAGLRRSADSDNARRRYPRAYVPSRNSSPARHGSVRRIRRYPPRTRQIRLYLRYNAVGEG